MDRSKGINHNCLIADLISIKKSSFFSSSIVSGKSNISKEKSFDIIFYYLSLPDHLTVPVALQTIPISSTNKYISWQSYRRPNYAKEYENKNCMTIALIIFPIKTILQLHPLNLRMPYICRCYLISIKFSSSSTSSLSISTVALPTEFLSDRISKRQVSEHAYNPRNNYLVSNYASEVPQRMPTI